MSTRPFQVADLRQQYAEKLHALTRTYAAGSSTRVKDLVDLVLLIDDGVVPDEALTATVRHVFLVRGTHGVPGELVSPPESWREPFARLAGEIGLDVGSSVQAHDSVAAHWRRARDVDGER